MTFSVFIRTKAYMVWNDTRVSKCVWTIPLNTVLVSALLHLIYIWLTDYFHVCLCWCVCLCSRAGERLNSSELQDFVHLHLEGLGSFSDLQISHAALEWCVYGESKLIQTVCKKHNDRISVKSSQNCSLTDLWLFSTHRITHAHTHTT